MEKPGLSVSASASVQNNTQNADRRIFGQMRLGASAKTLQENAQAALSRDPEPLTGKSPNVQSETVDPRLRSRTVITDPRLRGRNAVTVSALQSFSFFVFQRLIYCVTERDYRAPRGAKAFLELGTDPGAPEQRCYRTMGS